MNTPALSPAIVSAFAPTGRLRASINVGNPILANRTAAGAEPFGVSIDLARELGRRLGVEVDLIVFEKAAQSVDAVRGEQADIGFFAVDPARSEGLLFTAPYVLIEGSYLVPGASRFKDNADVDVAGTRVGVASGSAYDLFLTRELRQASIERRLHASVVVEGLVAGEFEVGAGIRQQLEAASAVDASLRVLPGRFMVIQQAMGAPASRGDDAKAFLSAFVEEMKASGFVAEAMKRHGIGGAIVAPAANAG